MRRALILIFLLLVSRPVLAQGDTSVAVSNLGDGQVVQGLVIVNGSASVFGFSSYELSFSYQDNPTETWFTLESSTTPVIEGELGFWDTTTLTDGDYKLRLRVNLLDGSVQETMISGLRVRNYTSVPTATPEPTSTVLPQFAPPTAQLFQPQRATETPIQSTPTPFDPNPVELEIPAISLTVGRGALLVLVLFLFFGLVLRFRRE